MGASELSSDPQTQLPVAINGQGLVFHGAAEAGAYGDVMDDVREAIVSLERR